MTDRGYKVVRFTDDFVVLTKSNKKANRALEVVKDIIEDKLKLTLHSLLYITFFNRMRLEEYT